MSLTDLGIVKRTITRANPAAVEILSRLGVVTIREAMGHVGLICSLARARLTILILSEGRS